MLSVSNLQASYGAAQVLFDISLSIGSGEVVTLLGRNGMGKTTTINAIMGLIRPTGGSVTFDDKPLAGLPPYRIAQCGIGLVPEGRQIFPTLTVEENLVATAAVRMPPARWTLADIYKLFPSLKARRSNFGTQLSGGELIRLEIWNCLKQLKAQHQAILVIDKNVDALAAFADRHVIIEKGRVVWTGTSAALKDDPSVKDRFLRI
jgi:branched-chain amino acid transport system ATP-binding protein